jgi:hypothetical protein
MEVAAAEAISRTRAEPSEKPIGPAENRTGQPLSEPSPDDIDVSDPGRQLTNDTAITSVDSPPAIVPSSTIAPKEAAPEENTAPVETNEPAEETLADQSSGQDKPDTQQQSSVEELIALLASRPNTDSLSALNESTLTVARVLLDNPAGSDLAIAAIHLVAAGTDSLPKLVPQPVNQLQIPDEIRLSYQLGLGWALWHQNEFQRAYSTWTQVVNEPLLLEFTATADRQRIADVLIDRLVSSSRVSDENIDQLRYADNYQAVLSSLDVIGAFAQRDADFLTSVERQRFLAQVAAGNVEAASEILSALESAQPLEQWITPQLAHAVFTLAVQCFDSSHPEAWSDRLLLAANTLGSAASSTEDSFLRVYLPAMRQLRPWLAAKLSHDSTVASEPSVQLIAEFCEGFVRQVLNSERRANYPGLGDFYDDLESAAAAVGRWSSDPQRKAEMDYLAADCYLRAMAESLSDIPSEQSRSRLLSYREAAASVEEGEPYASMLTALHAQETALRASDKTTATQQAVRAVEGYRKLIEAGLPPRLLADAHRYRAQLKQFIASMKLDAPVYSLESIVEDARAAQTLAVDQAQKELGQHMLAELLAKLVISDWPEFGTAANFRLELVDEAQQAIDQAIAARRQLELPYGNLAVTKLRVLWSRQMVSGDPDSKHNAMQTASQWITQVSEPGSAQTVELDISSQPPTIQCYWHFFVGCIFLEGGDQPVGKSHIETGYSIARQRLKTSNHIRQVLSMAMADLKFRELQTKDKQDPRRGSFNNELAEIRALLESISTPVYLLGIERDRWLQALDDYVKRRDAG